MDDRTPIPAGAGTLLQPLCPLKVWKFSFTTLWLYNRTAAHFHQVAFCIRCGTMTQNALEWTALVFRILKFHASNPGTGYPDKSVVFELPPNEHRNSRLLSVEAVTASFDIISVSLLIH